MAYDELGIAHKRLDDMLIASLRFQMRERAEVSAKLEELRRQCGEHISGPGFAIIYFDTGLEGVDTEVCFPVTEPVETEEVESRMLPGGEVLTMLHHGSHEDLRASYRKLIDPVLDHGVNIENMSREIYLEFNPDNPEENVTEIQLSFINFDERLAENLKRVLGEEARDQVMSGADEIALDSSKDERVGWVIGAMERLDGLADEREKSDILSRCAHTFSRKRIERLKAVYERRGDIDDVLEAMREDPDWYEDPVREGDIIYVTKIPYDPQGREEATTEDERRVCYCHCATIRRNLDETPPTFCYCGGGWYRQLWEGILEEPVWIELLKCLPKGDDVCEFAIHLPS
jgi:effector-binding domain-containing protein